MVHSEIDPAVEELRKKLGEDNIPEMIEFNGFRGPLKIWEINYPEDIEFREEFIVRDSLNKELMI